MLPLFVALLIASYLLPSLHPLQATALQTRTTTVHAAVIFTRTGERTPILGPNHPSHPPHLTALGATQLHAAGAAFRHHYLTSLSNPFTLVPSSRIAGLSPQYPTDGSVYALTPDSQHTSASAQAFLQGLYPPTSLNSSASATSIDPTAILANSTYIEAPLSGYQYPLLHVASPLDPTFLSVAADASCPGTALTASTYLSSEAAHAADARSRAVYRLAGGATGLGEVLDESGWRFRNAYVVYDWVSFRAAHNASVREMLGREPYRGVLEGLRGLAGVGEWGINAAGRDDEDFAWGGDGGQGSGSGSGGDREEYDPRLRAIAGRTLLAKILGQLLTNAATRGDRAKLSLLFGGHAPLMALASLLHLPRQHPDFYGLPNWGASAVFELYSIDTVGGDGGDADGNGTADGNANADPKYPDEDALWVRFFYRNGTGVEAPMPASSSSSSSSNTSDNGGDSANPQLQMYSIFGRGPSEAAVRWVDFKAEVLRVMLANPGDWCNACQAWSTSVFCPAFANSTFPLIIGGGGDAGAGGDGAMSPSVAGVIGAAATLGATALIAAAVVLLGGVRLHRVGGGVLGKRGSGRSRSSGLGGFKGSAKLASDQDLVIPKSKGGAGVSRIEDKGHERVGSWELHDEVGASLQKPARSMSVAKSPPPRYEEDDIAVSPFAEPVKPDERV